MWIEREGKKVGGTHLKGPWPKIRGQRCVFPRGRREIFVSGGDMCPVPGSTGGGWTTHESGTWLTTSEFYALMKIIFWG